MSNPLELPPKIPTVQPLLFEETELPIPGNTSKIKESPVVRKFTPEDITQLPNAELVALASVLPKDVLHIALNKLVGQKIADGTEDEVKLRSDIINYEQIRGELYMANMRDEANEQAHLQSRGKTPRRF